MLPETITLQEKRFAGSRAICLKTYSRSIDIWRDRHAFESEPDEPDACVTWDENESEPRMYIGTANDFYCNIGIEEAKQLAAIASMAAFVAQEQMFWQIIQNRSLARLAHLPYNTRLEFV